MSRTLFLFSASFPYGSGEQFLETELKYLSSTFERIEIIPLYVNVPGLPVRPVPAGVTVHDPVLPGSRAQRLLFAAPGLAMIASMRVAREIAARRLWRRRDLLKLLQAAALARGVMRSPQVQTVLESAGREDILYFYWGIGACYFLVARGKVEPVTVMRLHNSDLYEETGGGYIPFRQAVLGAIDNLVPISEDGAQYLQNRYDLGGSRINTFRLGTEDFGLSRASDDGILRICSCSNIVPVKRVPLIAEVLGRVRGRIEWTHIGDGSGRAALEGLLPHMPDTLTVRLLGRLPNAEVKRYYTENPVDLFINLSTHEGIPVSIMEVLSAGIPVLATACGGVAELVDKSVGSLVTVEAGAAEIAAEVQRLSCAGTQLRENARRRWQERCDASRRYREFAEFLDGIRQ